MAANRTPRVWNSNGTSRLVDPRDRKREAAAAAAAEKARLDAAAEPGWQAAPYVPNESGAPVYFFEPTPTKPTDLGEVMGAHRDYLLNDE